MAQKINKLVVETQLSIEDVSQDHRYTVIPSELTADRNTTLPLLTTDDTFVFEDHSQTLTNKTLTTPTIQNNANLTNSYIQIADIAKPASGIDATGRIYKKTGNDGLFWLPDSTGAEVDLTDNYTISNIGAGGVGVFKQKTGSILEFKKVNSTSATSGIAIVDDTTNSEVDVNLAILSLTTDVTPDINNDWLLTYDVSAGAHKKTLMKNLPGIISNVLYASAIASTTTTSTSYVDLPGMSVTLTRTGDITIHFVALQGITGGANVLVEDQLLINGVVISSVTTSAQVGSSGETKTPSFIHKNTGAAGNVVKVQWKTASSTALTTNRNMIVYEFGI